MTQTARSKNGDCPNCGSAHWKTLAALALTQRKRASARTRGPENWQRSETTASGETEAALEFAAPVRPADYDQMARYRKWYDDSILAAETRLAEIDAASDVVHRVLPGLFSHGPESKSISFARFAQDLDRLTRYDEALARWNATKLCLRCATPFIDATVQLPSSPTPVFHFSGQDRRCTQCGSYFWKRPEAVAHNRELTGKQALRSARTTLARAEANEADVAAKPPATGWLGRLARVLARKEPTVAEARDMLTAAERTYASAVKAADAIREAGRVSPRTRWCAACKCTYVCPE